MWQQIGVTIFFSFVLVVLDQDAVIGLKLIPREEASRVMKPLLHGDYPTSMKKIAGERIPTFTDRESKLVKGSYGFIGLIHYTNINITYNSLVLESNLRDFSADMAVLMHGSDLFENAEYPIEPWGLI
ncbi:hypothetical protein Ahy_Scaffold1g107030 isoform A [Arachis hypogaea]|uniref:Hydroxyisourate hydrolase n=2 Tax=Arachis hypogaea TaxID=3818 RepID=A0A444WU67_ARAHY|nr:hypothetical protein Ahy_Scaffold1g107030 isoform A [Arachis hypogaea]